MIIFLLLLWESNSSNSPLCFPLQAPVLIDQGTADGFLDSQLKPKTFALAAAKSGYPVELRYRTARNGTLGMIYGVALLGQASQKLTHVHINVEALNFPGGPNLSH